MDGWKDRTKSGRKESESENLKTRFQDCNLSRKQESKLPINQENSPSVKIASKADSRKTRKKENKEERFLANLLAILNERKLSVHRCGWKPIMMYNNNSK